jgi:hypothetical protein
MNALSMLSRVRETRRSSGFRTLEGDRPVADMAGSLRVEFEGGGADHKGPFQLHPPLMSTSRPSTFFSSVLPLLLPVLLVLVFALHMRSLPQFLDFRLHYDPTPPDVVAHYLVGSARDDGLRLDPHVIAYLVLPLFLVTALMLHRRARVRRPVASKAAFALTAIGTIYLGGLFGMWTAFYDGLSHMAPGDVDAGARAFAAMSAPRGAFLLTTTLAKLAFVGLTLQGLLQWDADARSRLAAVATAVGSALFLVFWDLDNWMLVGSVLLLVGLVAGRPRAARG